MNGDDYNEITKPNHYQIFPDTSVLDIIQDALSPEEFKGFLKGNILKYKLRAGDKEADPTKDIRKANHYQVLLFGEYE